MGKTEKTQKENHAIKVTKIPKTKRQKYRMNETLDKKGIKLHGVLIKQNGEIMAGCEGLSAQ